MVKLTVSDYDSLKAELTKLRQSELLNNSLLLSITHRYGISSYTEIKSDGFICNHGKNYTHRSPKSACEILNELEKYFEEHYKKIYSLEHIMKEEIVVVQREP